MILAKLRKKIIQALNRKSVDECKGGENGRSYERQDRATRRLYYENCLWQFHSRAWDREKQNEGILTKTMQLLCEEPVELETPEDRCYWVDAVFLAEGFKSRIRGWPQWTKRISNCSCRDSKNV